MSARLRCVERRADVQTFARTNVCTSARRSTQRSAHRSAQRSARTSTKALYDALPKAYPLLQSSPRSAARRRDRIFYGVGCGADILFEVLPYLLACAGLLI